jgi:predicted nucleic acid-binding protein
VATADRFYADPSALLKLYLREPQSRAMAAWRSRIGRPLLVTYHGQVEMINGIGLAAHRGFIARPVAAAALAALDADFAEGRLVYANLLWRAALKRAADLSRKHTAHIGCRSLDILHVASALELGLRQFVTFDARQQLLVRAVGLKLVDPADAA